MKKLFALAAVMVCCIISLNAQSQPNNQFYYDDCDWKADQPQYTYCEQDWMLFVFWPLDCEAACGETEICIGLFPGSDQDQEFDIAYQDLCCVFTVSGQYGWLFDASATFDYTNAGGVLAWFDFNHGSSFAGPWNLITNTNADWGPIGPYVLDEDNGGGHGAHYFKICATDVFIPGGFNGEAHLTTTMAFIYTI